MTGNAFMAYLRKRTQELHGSYVPDDDPEVEMYDGYVRIFDQRGESMTLKSPLSRQLRALSTQLLLTADEIDRRSFE